MARRKGGEKRGKILGAKEHERPKDDLSQKKLIIIACEGIRTEPQYFEAFFEKLKKERRIARGSCVIAPHIHTNPTGVLTDLLRYKGNRGEDYKDFDERWIVIDRDAERTGGGGHTKDDYNSAIRKSKAKGIAVAYSNPCFEIWYLLHFNYHNTAIDRDTAREKLKNYMSGYSKSDKGHFEKLYDKMDSAIRNARKLDSEDAGDEIKNAAKNPITRVYKIVEMLQSYFTDTHYLLSNENNRQHLLASLENVKDGRFIEKELIEE